MPATLFKNVILKLSENHLSIFLHFVIMKVICVNLSQNVKKKQKTFCQQLYDQFLLAKSDHLCFPLHKSI